MKRVLIVDDALFMRASLRMMLESSGFEIVGEAENGIEAIKMYEILKPDIVTMDLTMPELGGLEALKMMRRIDQDARVIVISSLGQESIVRSAINAGAISFIIKPFKEEVVNQTLTHVMNSIDRE